MKTFAQDYILNVGIALACLFTVSLLYGHATSLYYQHADISNFYVPNNLVASDICFGDKTQMIGSDRGVFKTETGYKAVLIRELSRVENNVDIKIYEEQVTPFFEKRTPGIHWREQQLPFLLQEGDYRWALYPTIDVHGVIRTDVPPLISNTFNVTPCD